MKHLFNLKLFAQPFAVVSLMFDPMFVKRFDCPRFSTQETLCYPRVSVQVRNVPLLCLFFWNGPQRALTHVSSQVYLFLHRYHVMETLSVSPTFQCKFVTSHPFATSSQALTCWF